MVQYLWNLSLEKIPLGWKTMYEQALKEIPDGKIDVGADGNAILIHPVMIRNKILTTFNLHKQKAIEIMKSNPVMERKQVSTLVRSDIILFNMISDWIDPDVINEKEFFTIKRFEDMLLNTESYFYEDDLDIEVGISIYAKYKFIRLV